MWPRYAGTGISVAEFDGPMRSNLASGIIDARRSISIARLRAAWRLIRSEFGDQAGVHLQEDYDPDKRPIVMIHGLGGSTLAWARLSNEVRDSPELHARFQVWHVLYHANAPMLVIRRRVQGYLDDAWRVLDPKGDAAARSGMVLIGHSLGGVIARMLCVESGDALWSAAFTVPPQTVRINAVDGAEIESVFRFQPYPGVSRAIFIAAPHQGSPNADRWIGRLFRTLIGGSAPEIQPLSRLARDHPDMVREELRATYQLARLNSVTSLQTAQPVRRAGESLMPASGIAYHIIAGVLPGTEPESDGAVPLSSALLPGAASTLVVKSGHNVYDNDEAVAEVLRILREDLMERRSCADNSGDRSNPRVGQGPPYESPGSWP
jgi:pimeloyl-ACP methyl ester carboxylesterase